MPTQYTVQFISGDYRLTGTLHLPDKLKPAAVVGCHGLLADRSSPKQIALAQALNAIGIAYLRFDHRGCGESQGPLAFKTLLTARCEDLCSAVAFLRNQANVGSVIGLFGSSFGGTVVMAAAAECRVPAIATYAAPIRSHTIGTAAEREIRAHHAISENETDGFAFDISSRLGRMKNILIMHGTNDEIVPPDHARRIYEAAQQPKKLILYENCTHRMTDPDHQRRFIEACAAWFEPYAIA